MVNKTISLPELIIERLKGEENASALISRLLFAHYSQFETLSDVKNDIKNAKNALKKAKNDAKMIKKRDSLRIKEAFQKQNWKEFGEQIKSSEEFNE